MSKQTRPLDFIREHFDWEGYVEGAFQVKYAGSELRVCCPNPDCDDSKFKMYVNPDKRQFHCFKCGSSSRQGCPPVTFVCWVEGISKMQATINLLNELEETTPDAEEFENEVRSLAEFAVAGDEVLGIRYLSSMPGVCVPLTVPTPLSHEPFMEYLMSRGLTEKEILSMGVQCVPQETHLLFGSNGEGQPVLKGDIGRRVMWPVYGPAYAGNKLVSWVGRDTEDLHGNAKYLNAPDSDLSRTFWPFCKPYDDTVVLVEGILDAYAVRRIPNTSAYACFSKHISESQMDILSDMWGVKNVVVAFDKKDAKPEMIKLVEELKTRFNVYVAAQHNLPKQTDCGDTLRMPNGVAILEEALTPIDVYSIEYERWKVT